MEDKLIEFETAKLAKDKGFDEECLYHWEIGNGDIIKGEKEAVFTSGEPLKNSDLMQEYSYKGQRCGEFSAPTQSLLQKWLRDKHDIVVEIQWDTISFGYSVFNPFEPMDRDTFVTRFEMWDYEQALEEGLKIGLNLIK